MKKLVVIAEAEEMKLVKDLGYDHLPVLITGVGALNVIDALKDISRDTMILNIGYAGSKDLEPGKYYTVDSVTLYHPNVEYREPTYGLNFIGYIHNDADRIDTKKCYTGCDFVLHSELSNCLFDMELAYIKALGFDHLVSIKYVSDNLDLAQHRETIKDE